MVQWLLSLIVGMFAFIRGWTTAISVYVVGAFSTVGPVKHWPKCELQKQGAETNQEVQTQVSMLKMEIFLGMTFKQQTALLFELKFQHDFLKLICFK